MNMIRLMTVLFFTQFYVMPLIAAQNHSSLFGCLASDSKKPVSLAGNHGSFDHKAFMEAVRVNNASITRAFALFSPGALVARDCFGNTALMIAAGFGYYEIVGILLVAGASYDDANYDGITPLMFAVEGGSFDVVNLLLNCGANVHAADRNEYTALDLALFHNNKKIIKRLCRQIAAHAVVQKS